MKTFEVRSELIALSSALLAGPLTPDELLQAAPSDTYLTGMLWPKGELLDAAEDENLSEGADAAEDGARDQGVPGYRAMRPCSIGITFAAEANRQLRVTLAETARYKPEQRGKAREWLRQPLNYSFALSTDGESRSWRVNRFETPAGPVDDPAVTVHVRRRVGKGHAVFTLTLINTAEEAPEGTPRDLCCLFQAGLFVASQDEKPVICPRAELPPAEGDDDALSAALLYRHAREYAVGHGIAASWSEPDNERVSSVATSWLPIAVVKGTSADGHTMLAEFDHKNKDAAYPRLLDAAWLERTDDRQNVVTALGAFVSTYEQWITETLVSALGSLDGSLRSAAERNLENCRVAAARMRAGVSTLADPADDTAWRAFALANSAMDRQSRFAVRGDRARPLRWRPFQLAYILMVLPGLVRPDDENRDTMDLLWFPTGGGKTEAYLGLTALAILLRRLREPQRRASHGVDVLMRYTLRLLTVQQFQRAASLICACEMLRIERGDLGAKPISIGLYVGVDTTPNKLAAAAEALAGEHSGADVRSTPRQLPRCPVCGTALPATSWTMSPGDTQVQLRCAAAECATHGMVLPVLTVDEQIYAEPPSLLIGTIDKFAQLPRRTDIRSLFGLGGGLPPDLIIQDELHLISGPLGTIAGLYETAIDMICTRGKLRPKVIGSTATIGQAERQVRALFDRSVLQFPPPGFSADDSFFAVRDDDGPDRLYVGISSAGRSPKFALQAVASALLEAASLLRARPDVSPDSIDPFWTCVLYFNSLRELGGAHVLMQDDVPRQMQFLAGRLAKQPRDLAYEPVELSSRVQSRDLPAILVELEQRLGGDPNDPYAPEPKDTVLASNMISVGVDIPRLGLMVVNGQPKSTAEYIQSSSRIGRNIEGLVVTLFQYGRPRDLSHFEHFCGYHSALYRNVEATSVTPWAPRARDKALHAVFATLVRHLLAGMEPDEAPVDFRADMPGIKDLVDAILERSRSSSNDIEGQETEEQLDAILRQWALRAQDGRSAGTRLLYWERKAPFGRSAPHLMFAAEEGNRNTALSWATPNSMREVEPSTAFVLQRNGRT
ncbi:hypothetical protein ABIF35_006577 [Bradyrhizobium japonicum]|uniref:helicase n=1 Tax=Bradyrhizobium diazoefficiens TaxID=1355477 RepID=UPI003488E78C